MPRPWTIDRPSEFFRKLAPPVVGFRIEFTDELRAQLLELLNEMRRDLSAEDVARSHMDARRCRGCGYRAECGQALEEMTTERRPPTSD